MRKILFFLLLSMPIFLSAQMHQPISLSQKFNIQGDVAELVFSATIEDGWHLYSTKLASGGPTSASLNIEEIKGLEPIGELTPSKNEIEKMDPIFGMMVRYFEKNGEFVQKYKIIAKDYLLKGYLEYGACDDENCLPPTSFDFDISGSASLSSQAGNGDKTNKTEATTISVIPTVPLEIPTDAQPRGIAPSGNSEFTSALWTPVVDELRLQQTDSSAAPSSSLWLTFLLGFGGGLLALLTPCVWPIIPMTVSFFLKRAENKSKALKEALLYGVSIVVIYLALGLLVTAVFGASALNALSTNAVFNLLFCLLLLLFAASFLGGFELTLPSSWTNKVDEKASSTTGFMSIFLMAFTLALVSFSCTGPIIGFLLVEVSVTGSLFGPAVGMFGFALALALPFTLFALFPSWLKQAPRSGGWMNVVKVSLGFVELAFALKFFSVADLSYGWGLLDRETFLAIWIVLFALLGLYLLSLIRFPHDDASERTTSVPRFFMALISLSFAVYMIPGLWGAPCKAISAFAPPMWTQDFNLSNNEVHAQFNDYDQGMAFAQRQEKPVLLDFTGYGCVNCRKMESTVWTDETVSSILKDDYVLITLFVDDKTPLPQPITVEEQGVSRKLRTVGDKWSYLQRYKFGANAQPFYVPVDNMGKPLSGSYSFNEDIPSYINFLNQGLINYKKNK